MVSSLALLEAVLPTTQSCHMASSLALPEVQKKYLESPSIPMVPGPVMSAKTLMMENVPAIKPKPKPDTGKRKKHLAQKQICGI